MRDRRNCDLFLDRDFPNHCALGAIAAKADISQDECPFHPMPAKQPENSSNLLCCKILHVVFPAVVKDWARDDANFSDVNLGVLLCTDTMR